MPSSTTMLSLATSLYCTGTTLSQLAPDLTATSPAPVLSVEEIRTTIRRTDSTASDEDLPLILRNDTDGTLVKTEEEEIDAPVLKTEEKEIEEIAEEEVTGTTSPSSSSPFTFQTSFGMLGTSLVMVLMQQHL